METINCFNLRFSGLSRQALLELRGVPTFVVTVNSEFIVKANTTNPRLKAIIDANCSTFDGQIPYLLAKIQHPFSNFEKISGSDFFFDVCAYAAKHRLKLFLLGGRASANAQATRVVAKRYGLSVYGYSPDFEEYPFSLQNERKIREEVERYRPDILLVGFGAVKQEYWIDDNLDFLRAVGVQTVIGVGGTFEFVSGEIPRAPVLIQRICLEGVYRLLQEPKWFRFSRLLKSFGVFWFWLRYMVMSK